jgi:DNA-binding PadR family transcriptional regulator
MELSHTAYVILGMLGWQPMSGYEIKSLVDKSTRFFWAASYGQIYPELRKLAAAGLIEGKASPQGRAQAQRVPADARGTHGAPVVAGLRCRSL